MTVRIERIAPPLVEKMFPQCAGWLERAVARCKDEDIGDVRDECAEGDAELWVAYIGKELSGVFVTQLQQSKFRRVLELRYLAGMPFRHWIETQPTLMAWAKQRGCDVIRIRGRRGWLRLLPEHGWRPTAYEMELAI